MYFTQLSDEYKYWKIIKILKQYYQHISLVQKKRVVGFRPIVNANMHAILYESFYMYIVHR